MSERSTIEELEARVRETHADVLSYESGGYEDANCYARFHAALTDLAARAREAEKIVAAAELLTRRDTFDMRIIKVREDNLIELLDRRSAP